MTTDATAARGDFLRQLPGDEFVPPERAVAAAARVTGADLPNPTGARGRCAEEVAAFAAAFWALPPDARRATWRDLVTRTTAPAAAARLRTLAAGLDVIPPADGGDPLASEVARVYLDGLIAAPRDRAIARSRWVTDATPEQRQAAERFRADFPAIAALDPLFADLSTGNEPRPAPDTPESYTAALWSLGPAFTVTSPGSDWSQEPPVRSQRADESWAADTNDRRAAKHDGQRAADWEDRKPTANASGGGGGGSGYSILLAVVLIGGGALLRTATKPPPDYKPPDFKLPAVSPAPPFRFNPYSISEDELVAIALYDPASGLPQPPKYGRAKLAGISDATLKQLREKYRVVQDADKEVERLREEMRRVREDEERLRREPRREIAPPPQPK